VWAGIAMDFIEGFPRVNGKFVILTIVDWLSKYVHFIPLDHPYTTTSVARAFFDNIAHLHCIPSSIVCRLHQHVLEGAVHAHGRQAAAVIGVPPLER
jgi:hypothetical protein